MIANAPKYLSQANERQAIEELAFDYERQGYEVIVSPSSTQLPDFLRGFRPDLIAIKPDDSIVVEVKLQGKNGRENDQLQSVSKAIQQQPGWRLRVVVKDEFSKPDSLSLEETNSLLAQSEQLEKEDRLTASLLTAWPAIEAAMRWSVDKNKIEVPDFSARTLIARLYSDGDLERDEYDLLVQYSRTRNLVAHGYRENIEPGELERLREIARRLVTE